MTLAGQNRPTARRRYTVGYPNRIENADSWLKSLPETNSALPMATNQAVLHRPASRRRKDSFASMKMPSDNRKTTIAVGLASAMRLKQGSGIEDGPVSMLVFCPPSETKFGY